MFLRNVTSKSGVLATLNYLPFIPLCPLGLHLVGSYPFVHIRVFSSTYGFRGRDILLYVEALYL